MVELACFDAEDEGAELFRGGGDDSVGVVAFAELDGAVVGCGDVDAVAGEADAFVVAWGLAYEDGATEVISVEGHRRWQLAAPENVVRYFGRAEDLSARLVWLADTGGAPSWAA